MAFLEDYKVHTEERAALGVPPLALTAEQTADLVELLKASPIAEQDYTLDIFENKIPAGVDDAAYVKAAFLNDVVQGNVSCDAIDAVKACEILGLMLGGFNVTPLVEALKIDGDVANTAAEQLKNTILVYDAFNDVKTLMDGGNAKAKEIVESWANGEWLTNQDRYGKRNHCNCL